MEINFITLKKLITDEGNTGKLFFRNRIIYYCRDEVFNIENFDKIYIPIIGCELDTFFFKIKDILFFKVKIFDVSSIEKWEI